MNKKILLVILLVIVSFSFGCSSNNSTGYTNFRTGSTGLSLRFLPYSPPLTIYDNENVDFIIEISNKGAHDINMGKLFLSGFDRNIINIYENYHPFESIEGKSEYNSQGEKLIVDRYAGTKISLPYGVEEHSSPIEAIACYEYQTIASFPICIDANPRVSKHDGCFASDVSGSSQGGPISVSHIDVESGTGKMRFVITLKNVGQGDLIDYNSCPFGYKYNEMNNIKSYSVDISGVTLECQPDNNNIKMDDMGQARIYCKAGNLNENQAAYLTPITIKLNYDYKDSTSTSVRIKGNI